jgi:hypothetical protein
MSAALDQLLATLWNRSSSVDQLRDATALARAAVTGIDAENEAAPSREAATLARMMSPGGPSTVYVLEELRKLDNVSADRALTRKVAVAIAAALDERVREVEAAEAAKPAEQVRREREQAEREAKLQALFARVPTLFRSDFLVSQLGKAAWSKTPRPIGTHVGYARDFTVGRVLQNLMETTKVPGWPPRYSDSIEWPNSAIEEDAAIVDPIRRLCEKSSVSEDEVAGAVERAQHVLLTEFSKTCAAIRAHYPDGLPRFFALPSIATARAA